MRLRRLRVPTPRRRRLRLRSDRGPRSAAWRRRGAEASRVSEQAAALALATASGRLAGGASFKLCGRARRAVAAAGALRAAGRGGGGLAVGEQQSSRPGFGAVPLYTLSSADEPGKRYDRYDFASYRGAEEAYRVRDVRPPPPSDEEAAEQAAARVDAARRAANQTRAKVRLGMLMLE